MALVLAEVCDGREGIVNEEISTIELLMNMKSLVLDRWVTVKQLTSMDTHCSWDISLEGNEESG